MIVLSIRTDKPEAEIGLFENQKELGYIRWQAHRELSTTILGKMEALLKNQQLNWQDIGGVICFEGPGSFTGLRIGLSVGNSIAYGLSIPITSVKGKDWVNKAIKELKAGKNKKVVTPFYGAEAKTTKPKK